MHELDFYFYFYNGKHNSGQIKTDFMTNYIYLLNYVTYFALQKKRKKERLALPAVHLETDF